MAEDEEKKDIEAALGKEILNRFLGQQQQPQTQQESNEQIEQHPMREQPDKQSQQIPQGAESTEVGVRTPGAPLNRERLLQPATEKDREFVSSENFETDVGLQNLYEAQKRVTGLNIENPEETEMAVLDAQHRTISEVANEKGISVDKLLEINNLDTKEARNLEEGHPVFFDEDVANQFWSSDYKKQMGVSTFDKSEEPDMEEPPVEEETPGGRSTVWQEDVDEEDLSFSQQFYKNDAVSNISLLASTAKDFIQENVPGAEEVGDVFEGASDVAKEYVDAGGEFISEVATSTKDGSLEALRNPKGFLSNVATFASIAANPDFYLEDKQLDISERRDRRQLFELQQEMGTELEESWTELYEDYEEKVEEGMDSEQRIQLLTNLYKKNVGRPGAAISDQNMVMLEDIAEYKPEELKPNVEMYKTGQNFVNNIFNQMSKSDRPVRHDQVLNMASDTWGDDSEQYEVVERLLASQMPQYQKDVVSNAIDNQTIYDDVAPAYNLGKENFIKEATKSRSVGEKEANSIWKEMESTVREHDKEMSTMSRERSELLENVVDNSVRTSIQNFKNRVIDSNVNRKPFSSSAGPIKPSDFERITDEDGELKESEVYAPEYLKSKLRNTVQKLAGDSRLRGDNAFNIYNNILDSSNLITESMARKSLETAVLYGESPQKVYANADMESGVVLATNISALSQQAPSAIEQVTGALASTDERTKREIQMRDEFLSNIIETHFLINENWKESIEGVSLEDWDEESTKSAVANMHRAILDDPDVSSTTLKSIAKETVK